MGHFQCMLCTLGTHQPEQESPFGKQWWLTSEVTGCQTTFIHLIQKTQSDTGTTSLSAVCAQVQVIQEMAFTSNHIRGC